MKNITRFTIVELLREYDRLRQERDELLAACRAMSEVARVDCADKMDWAAFWKAANQIDAVIARVEQ